MEKILLLLHTNEDGSLSKLAFEAVTAARELASTLGESHWSVGLVGGAVSPAAESIGACGAGAFLGVEGDPFGVARYATDALAAEAICRKAEATLVIAPATSRWSRVLAGVTARLNGTIDTHVVGVSADQGKVSLRRWVYRQRIETELSRAARPWVLLLDGGAAQPWSGEAQSATLELLPVEAPDAACRTSVEGVRAPSADQQTIRPDASLLFVAGAGWTKKQQDGQVNTAEAAELIQGFVGKAKASLGSSKSLVDLSSEGQAVLPFLTHMHQVGQTGSTPRHPRGLATCCHGEEPHVVGWRFINDRRAVNLDPNCGWAQGKADVLYVADAFEVMRKLNELLG